jgi:hypothetical protein
MGWELQRLLLQLSNGSDCPIDGFVLIDTRTRRSRSGSKPGSGRRSLERRNYGVKRFRDFIVSCGWFDERQESVMLINYGLSLISTMMTVDFYVDIDGNVYEVGNSAELL